VDTDITISRLRDYFMDRKGDKMKITCNNGKIGWAVLWILGVPLPVLFFFYLMGFGHH